MAGTHNKSYQPRSRKNKANLPKVKDPESQTDSPPHGPQQETTVVDLMIFAFHTFCAVTLYATPYAVMQGGWLGLVLLVGYFALSFVNAVYIVEIINHNPDLHTYADVGRLAFGVHGGRTVWVSDFLLIWASCVESVIISHASILYVSPRDFTTLMSQQSKRMTGVIWVVTTASMALACNLANIEHWNARLTCLGAFMNLAVVGCLVKLYVYSSFEHSKLKKKPKNVEHHLPVANGFFALCFTGHSSLPRIYSLMRGDDVVQHVGDVRSLYIGVILVAFVASFLLYWFTAIIGYLLFGASVKSIYVLSMPMNFWDSKVALFTMVMHQFMRYMMGIHEMVGMLTAGITQHQNAWRAFYTCLLVILTIPVTILAPSYSTVMSFIGSTLGIVVSLIIPAACSIQLMWQPMGASQRFLVFFILATGITALVASVVSLVS